MKSRWRIALGTGVAAILLIVVVRVFTPREPEHDGRRLSDLLHELPVAGSGFAERHQSTRFAVNCIGTNAIPFLLGREDRDTVLSQLPLDPVREGSVHHPAQSRADGFGH